MQLDNHHDHGSTIHHGPSRDNPAASSESDVDSEEKIDSIGNRDGGNNHLDTAAVPLVQKVSCMIAILLGSLSPRPCS